MPLDHAAFAAAADAVRGARILGVAQAARCRRTRGTLCALPAAGAISAALLSRPALGEQGDGASALPAGAVQGLSRCKHGEAASRPLRGRALAVQPGCELSPPVLAAHQS